MTVPTSFTSLSTTASSNPPDGSTEGPRTWDDHQRQSYVFHRQNYDSIQTINTTLTGKASLSGATFTGPVVVPAGATGSQVPRKSEVDALIAAAALTAASQAEMEAGTEPALRSMSPLRVSQAIQYQLSPAASQAEAEAGTESAIRRFSPLRIAQAIANLQIFKSVASDAEARGFTENTKVITAAKLRSAFQGGNISLGSSGFQVLPGELIIQWAEISVSGSGSSHSFPIPFPHSCFGIVCSDSFSTGAESTTHAVATYNWSPSGFNAASSNNTAANDTTAFYIALGY